MTFDSAMPYILIAGEAIVFALLLRRKAWRNLPLFLSYIGWALVSDIAGLIMQTRSSSDYLLFYDIQFSIDSILQVLVWAELICAVLQLGGKSISRGYRSLLGLLVVLTVLLFWPLAGVNVGPEFTKSAHSILQIGIALELTAMICFVAIACIVKIFSISKREMAVQAAVGMGSAAMLSLALATLRASTHSNLASAAAIGYLAVLIYWIVCFSG